MWWQSLSDVTTMIIKSSAWMMDQDKFYNDIRSFNWSIPFNATSIWFRHNFLILNYDVCLFLLRFSLVSTNIVTYQLWLQQQVFIIGFSFAKSWRRILSTQEFRPHFGRYERLEHWVDIWSSWDQNFCFSLPQRWEKVKFVRILYENNLVTAYFRTIISILLIQ